MINNQFYDELNEKWHEGSDHPVALLRAENRSRVPWILQEVESYFGRKVRVLDIGCGGGFLTKGFADRGDEVVGLDCSESSLKIAALADKKSSYIKGDAYQLPFAEESFDVVCAMDLLEHVEDPAQVIGEGSRVLKKGGLFFYHTFNRNLLSYLLVIKGVEWGVKNTPKNMHAYPLFITPKELKDTCSEKGLKVKKMRGFHPKLFQKAWLKLLVSRKVPEDFTFVFSKNLQTGYSGFAIKSL